MVLPRMHVELELEEAYYNEMNSRELKNINDPESSKSHARLFYDALRKIYHRPKHSRHSRYCNDTSLKAAKNERALSETAAYDGLRGIACLIVFNFHFLYPYTQTITHGFATELEDKDWRYPHQLPILCLLVRGRAMVTLFFAISGYVLSYNFLASIRTDQQLKGVSRLGSLALRRWLRLFLPASLSMLMVCFGAFLGAFDKGRLFQDSQWRSGFWEQHPPRLDSFQDQIKNFSGMWWDWSSLWEWSFSYSEYDPHTWTIPVEFRGSMVLFVMLLASVRLRQRWRMLLVACVTAYCFVTGKAYLATFTGGALVADIHLSRSPTLAHDEEKASLLPTSTSPIDEETSSSRLENIQTPNSEAQSTALKIIVATLKWILLCAALYILSYPDDDANKTPGFVWLEKTTPPGYGNLYQFWQSFASVFILWCVTRISPIRTLFCFSIPQYLGKISYGFYLVHGPLLHSAGFALQPMLFSTIGNDTTAKWCGGLFIGWITMLTLSIITAHLFWKFVDMPLVKATKWLERLMSCENGGSSS